jgi:hypothetical protein
MLFNLLARESDFEGELPLPPEKREAGTDDGPSGMGHLVEKVLAMYSLNERALNRVKAMLEKSVVGVKVLTFSDKSGGSPALREAARTADVFLIVTGAAKHAATGYIEANRGRGLKTLRSHGKGSASMLRLLASPA